MFKQNVLLAQNGIELICIIRDWTRYLIHTHPNE